jgi:hypothetical protein
MKKNLERVVEPELLDELPPQDHRALRSRLDLQRLNKLMKHPRVMANALSKNLGSVKSPRIVEIGAGDGDFLLRTTRRLQRQWPVGDATLVDRLNSFDPQIGTRFNNLGWRVHTEIADVLDWLRQLQPNAADAIVANLFLHQFRPDALAEMLRLAARSTNLFIAIETSRAWLPRFCSHFLWTMGCNSVTRNDGRISIRAGFLGRELSALWPDEKNWQLTEHPIGLFSHLFIARRKA